MIFVNKMENIHFLTVNSKPVSVQLRVVNAMAGQDGGLFYIKRENPA